jgi:hypothetical protein
MTLKEFQRYADLYGGDLDHWPPPVSVEAMALLDISPEARTILADAAALDSLLDRATPSVSEESVQRTFGGIAARLDAPSRPRLAPWMLSAPPLQFWPTASFLAMMGVAGFLITSQGILPAQASSANGLPDVLVMNNYLGAVQ